MSDRKKTNSVLVLPSLGFPQKSIDFSMCKKWKFKNFGPEKYYTFQRAGWLERKISNTDLTRFLFQDWKRQKSLKFAHIKSDFKNHAILKSRNCNFKSKCDKGFFPKKFLHFIPTTISLCLSFDSMLSWMVHLNVNKNLL